MCRYRGRHGQWQVGIAPRLRDEYTPGVVHLVVKTLAVQLMAGGCDSRLRRSLDSLFRGADE